MPNQSHLTTSSRVVCCVPSNEIEKKLLNELEEAIFGHSGDHFYKSRNKGK